MNWYKRYPSAAFDGMRCLTLEEIGAYNIIIDLIYERDGNVPDDDRIMSGWLRCAVQRWRRIKARLVGLGKIIIRNGLLTNAKADKEMTDLRTSFEEHRKRSQRGGQVSAEKRNKNNETTQPTLQALKTQNEKEEKKILVFDSATRLPTAERKAVTDFDLVLSDGTIIEHEEFEALNQEFGITNSRDRAGAAKRSYLKDVPGRFFLDRFHTQLTNQKFRKKVPMKPTAAQKQEQDAALDEREQARRRALAIRAKHGIGCG